jgi:hypothetical protein
VLLGGAGSPELLVREGDPALEAVVSGAVGSVALAEGPSPAPASTPPACRSWR